MKSISYWASRHLWPARLLLVAIFVLLNLLAVFVGKSLSLLQVSLPFYLVYLLLLPFAAAWLLHPGGHSNSSFRLRKWCEGTVGGICFMLVVILFNQKLPVSNAPVWSNTVVKKLAEQKLTNSKVLEEKPVLRKKHQRQKLRNNIKTIRSLYQQSPKTTKIILIILAVVVAIGLLWPLSLLVCQLSCAGSEALAIFVSVLGTGLIVYLAVLVVKGIERRYQRKLRENSNWRPGKPASLHR